MQDGIGDTDEVEAELSYPVSQVDTVKLKPLIAKGAL